MNPALHPQFRQSVTRSSVGVGFGGSEPKVQIAGPGFARQFPDLFEEGNGLGVIAAVLCIDGASTQRMGTREWIVVGWIWRRSGLSRRSCDFDRSGRRGEMQAGAVTGGCDP